jgi:uncharacterized protein YaaN involved in tellurite resistance
MEETIVTTFPEKLCETLRLEVTPSVQSELERIKEKIDLFDTLNVGRFGAPEQKTQDIGHEHNEAVKSISGTITGLVSSLEKADPRMVLKRRKSGFMSRFTGGDAVQKVEYVKSTEGIDSQLSEVPSRIERLERIVRMLEDDHRSLLATQHQLKLHLVAGKWYLEENPEAGAEEPNSYGLGSPRDRFAKRLASLTALLTSNDATLHQLQLIRANSINMLDRLHEITSVLVPTWRSHRMGLYVNDQDYDAIQEAAEAHEALVESLRAV